MICWCPYDVSATFNAPCHVIFSSCYPIPYVKIKFRWPNIHKIRGKCFVGIETEIYVVFVSHGLGDYDQTLWLSLNEIYMFCENVLVEKMLYCFLEMVAKQHKCIFVTTVVHILFTINLIFALLLDAKCRWQGISLLQTTAIRMV